MCDLPLRLMHHKNFRTHYACFTTERVIRKDDELITSDPLAEWSESSKSSDEWGPGRCRARRIFLYIFVSDFFKNILGISRLVKNSLQPPL
jgi:hypothetical protein